MYMISNETIKAQFDALDEVSFVEVTGDGYHYHLVVVSDAFEHKSTVARQRWVYQQLQTFISDGSLHALSMKTWTKAEWEAKHG
mgnify:CR=1 FL=1|tara:strand:- start:359 stop:610 length:252 start_codon:yes stop_codon:yes gene_type:complete